METTKIPQWAKHKSQVHPSNETEINMNDNNVIEDDKDYEKNNQIALQYDQNNYNFVSPIKSDTTSRSFMQDSFISIYFTEPDESYRDYFPGSKKYYLTTKKCNKCVRKTIKFFGMIIAFPFALLVFFPDPIFFILFLIFNYSHFIPATQEFKTARDWFLGLSIAAFVFRISRCVKEKADRKFEKYIQSPNWRIRNGF